MTEEWAAVEGRLAGGLRQVEYWSLDPLLVGGLWWLVLPKAAWVSGWALPVLLAALWLGYVADRLLDIGTGSAPQTLRHRYVAENRKQMGILWLCVLVVGIGLAHATLDRRILEPGWVLVGLLGAYLWLIQRMEKGTGRMLCKRIGVAVLFTGGVGCLTGSWALRDGQWGLALLALGALANLMLLSRAEADGTCRYRVAGRGLQLVLLVLAALGIGLWPLQAPVALAALTGLLEFGWLVEKARRELGLPVRMLADLALVDMALVFAIGRWLLAG